MTPHIRSEVAKPNVLLYFPKTGMDCGSTVAPPHAMLAVAAPLLKAGYKVRIVDQRVDKFDEETIKEMVSDELVCVGISSMTGTQLHFALQFAKMARRLTDGKVPIVWGGCHPTVQPEQTLMNPYVDVVAIGEGDYILLDLCNAWSRHESIDGIDGVIFKDGAEIKGVNKKRKLSPVNELLPTPWELIDVEKYIHRDMYVSTSHRVLDIGQTSRGCPFDCGFCSSASIRERKWRAMDAQLTIDFITENVRRFNLDGFWLRDDEFYIHRKRAHQVFEGMIKNDLNVSFYTSGTRADVFCRASDEELKTMVRAGAHTLKFGAESGSQRILNLMQKGLKVEQTVKANLLCKQYGITPTFSLIVGYPTETFDEINQTIELGYRLKRENPRAQLETMCTYTALPGTPDWDLAIKHGLIPPKSLEEWTNWQFDEYDFEGKKIPWFNKQERVWVGNISYMSILGNALENLFGSLKNPLIKYPLLAIAKPMSAYYRYRLSNKKYRWMPDLALVRYLREKIFYKSAYTTNKDVPVLPEPSMATAAAG